MAKVRKKSFVVAVFDAKPYDREYLAAADHEARLDWRFLEARLAGPSALLARGAAAACIFVNDHADAKALAGLKQAGVRHLALRCAGFNNVDLKAAAKLGLRVTRVPSYSPHAVAEHTLALLLALNRRIHRAHLRVIEHDFSLHGLMGWDLFGKCVGVVGTGRIGRIVAEIFRGFGCRVLAHDVKPDVKWASAHKVSYVPLDRIFEASDVVTLHAPLTPGTHHMIDADRLAQMKAGSYIVNTGRGKLIDTRALIAALKQKKLGGVALDVYEEEEGVFFENLSEQPLADDMLARLLSFPNVLVTSHQGFFTREAMSEIAKVTVENLWRAAQGRAALKGTQI